MHLLGTSWPSFVQACWACAQMVVGVDTKDFSRSVDEEETGLPDINV